MPMPSRARSLSVLLLSGLVSSALVSSAMAASKPTAPPRVPKTIDVVANDDVVRGQYGPPPGNRMLKKAKVWATNPFIVGGVGAAAVAIPVALSDNDGPHS